MQRGLKDGTWDIAFIVTDWIAEAVAEGALLDLGPRMRAQPVPDYPTGWAPSLTRFQSFGDAVYGLPYHDGPECLVYRQRPLRRPSGAGRLCQATRPAAGGPAHLGRVRDGGPLLHPSGSRAVGHHLRRLPRRPQHRLRLLPPTLEPRRRADRRRRRADPGYPGRGRRARLLPAAGQRPDGDTAGAGGGRLGQERRTLRRGRDRDDGQLVRLRRRLRTTRHVRSRARSTSPRSRPDPVVGPSRSTSTGCSPSALAAATRTRHTPSSAMPVDRRWTSC